MRRTGFFWAPDRPEQVVVLHVAGADLQHVGILADQLDLIDRHDLGDDGQTGLVAGFGEDLEAFFAEALEVVRAGAGLEGAAAEGGGAGFLDFVAHSRSWLRDSTEQGPAMMQTCLPPTVAPRVPPRATMVRSFLTSREAILYLARTGMTFSTPGAFSMFSLFLVRSSPMAAMTVRSVPLMT